MKVLMFGWEFPPHISGGLGTACFGLTHSLAKERVSVLFVVPRLHGDEPSDQVNLINASTILIPTSQTDPGASVKKKPKKVRGRSAETTRSTNSVNQSQITYISVDSNLSPYPSAASLERQNTQETLENWNYQLPVTADEKPQKPGNVAQQIARAYKFSGTYGVNLHEEVNRYAEVASQIARQHTFDVIHAHDWMTYPAGITAKKISGKPLIVHVHATEFDRSGENVNPQVFAIEKEGLQQADRIVAVSQWTKHILVNRYNIPSEKIHVVHNGITPKEEIPAFNPPPVGSHIVTFLGRVTYQKGPQYFVEAAYRVLRKFPDVHFVVAGAGDLLPHMIERAAALKISSHFHFTGFLKGDMVDKIWSMSNLYVMPSVSEPFGIAPLEAIQSGVPVIVSNQSGVAEVMPHAIKVDFWNTEDLASAICSVLQYSSLSNTLKRNGVREVKNITWDKAAKKINTIYDELVTTP